MGKSEEYFIRPNFMVIITALIIRAVFLIQINLKIQKNPSLHYVHVPTTLRLFFSPPPPTLGQSVSPCYSLLAAA